MIQRKKKRKVRLFLVFFFLFRPFLSSSLSFKRYAQTDRRRKKRERAETREDDAAARKRRQQLQKNSGRKAVSLSPPLKNYSHKEREREREKERQRESKKESAKNFRCIVERNVFFSFARKKKRISHLISSHLCWKDYASRAAKRRKKRRRRRWWWRRW